MKVPLEKAYDEIELKQISEVFQVLGLDSLGGDLSDWDVLSSSWIHLELYKMLEVDTNVDKKKLNITYCKWALKYHPI